MLRLFIIAAGLAIMGCFLKTPGMAPKTDVRKVAPDSAFVKTSDRLEDSLSTFTAQFARIDSMASPDSTAAELLQMALRNYLGMAQKSEKEDDKYFEVKSWLANHMFEQGKYDSALTLYRDILENDKSGAHRAEASQMIAQAYVRLGEADKAETWYQQQLKGEDTATSNDARDRLAQALYVQAERAEKAGKLEEAAKYYGDVTRAFPTADISPIALYNCTVLRERLGQWQKALAGYNKFTELYYNSPMLPRVLFRQAKTRERLNDWAGAADGFWKLANTYPSSEQGEPALYNAGFAYVNARQSEKAALAFESYATKYPQTPESPNLLFRAVEIYAEMQQWNQVSELQAQFQRRYGQDRNRQVQAQCLGGLAAYHQGRIEAARNFFTQAVESYRTQAKRDPQSRVYAAQSQFILGEIAHLASGKTPLREATLDADLETKTRQLKVAAAAYLKVIDFRIAEWALRSAHAMGALFEEYGHDVRQAPKPIAKTPAQGLEHALQTLESVAAAWIQAAENYEQAQAIAVAQGLHNRYSEEAANKAPKLRRSYAMAADSLWMRLDRAWPVQGLPGEKAVAEAMERLAYRAVLATQAVQVGASFDKAIDALPADSLIKLGDSLETQRPTRSLGLKFLHDLGRRYRHVADTVRSATLPTDSMEAFFFQSQLVRQGLAPIDKEAVQAYDAAFQVAKERRLLQLPWIDSLRLGLGQALYVQAKSCDVLARRALSNPPIPFDAPPAMRKTYEPKFEELGYQLQDAAMAGYKVLIQRAKARQVDTLFAELALMRLFESEPDAWSQANRDTAATATQGPLMPRKPWDNQDLTPERMAFLKGLHVGIPHLDP